MISLLAYLHTHHRGMTILTLATVLAIVLEVLVR